MQTFKRPKIHENIKFKHYLNVVLNFIFIQVLKLNPAHCLLVTHLLLTCSPLVTHLLSKPRFKSTSLDSTHNGNTEIAVGLFSDATANVSPQSFTLTATEVSIRTVHISYYIYYLLLRL